ncbi:MAG TPA: squalene--hopene cyclase [Natronosporangium sp.]|nr:squalene--hopene cyclase [Natronosporangium sp.]
MGGAPSVDLEAAIGFVVAHGDDVDRARLAYLRTGVPPEPDLLELVERGQVPGAGWPAQPDSTVASIDATCFRLAELADLGALGRPAARQALDWLAEIQREDGTWDEDEALAEHAPPWAAPGDPEAQLYLTANAAFWFSVAGRAARSGGPMDTRVGGAYAGVVTAATNAIVARLRPDGSWPSYLVTGWLTAAVLYAQGRYEPSIRMQLVLERRLPDLAAGEVAWLACSLRWLGVRPEERLLVDAFQRLADTQRSDGGWQNPDEDPLAVHTALTVLRACLPTPPEQPS